MTALIILRKADMIALLLSFWYRYRSRWNREGQRSQECPGWSPGPGPASCGLILLRVNKGKYSVAASIRSLR